MLEKLLNLLQAPRTHSLNDLAHSLDTSPEMVHTMLEELERMGFVRQVRGCDQSCQGCATNKACTPAGTARIWTLIEGQP
jgi:Mn-dependent DtxR family transcriptional regulator